MIPYIPIARMISKTGVVGNAAVPSSSQLVAEPYYRSLLSQPRLDGMGRYFAMLLAARRPSR